MNKIVFTPTADTLELSLKELVTMGSYDHLFVLSDSTTHTLCMPLLRHLSTMAGASEIVVAAGDDHKDISSAQHVWEEFERGKASRQSLLVNVGGGMITDLGGWCASCFKRGIDFVNLPTTLLSMVDASVGGKTGVNFHGLKNEIGVFAEPRLTLINTRFLSTLDKENILAGFAEMVKHSLISSEESLAELFSVDPINVNYDEWDKLIRRSVDVKRSIVDKDPREKGLRRVLNFGHTIGHAIESLSMKKGKILLHGYAVAHGMVGELYLSVMKNGFPVNKMRRVVSFLREHYGIVPITCNDYPALLNLMNHDKKNTHGIVNFTLLKDIGEARTDQSATKEEILETLDFMREGL